jgi:hypothetical protein
MTGRAAGLCAGYGVPGYANPVPGRGYGMGFGRGRGFRGGGGGGGGGRGWRHWYYATGVPGWMRFGGYAPFAPAPYPGSYQAPYQAPDPQFEKTALTNQAQALQAELDAIKQRLAELEASGTESPSSG